MAEERGWVIETARQSYWSGRKGGVLTEDIADAVRFSRFVDAERVRCHLLSDIADLVRSAEHVWATVDAAKDDRL